MKQERYNNQSKIFGEITASKFQEQHTPQFSVCRYEDLCPAAKTELHLNRILLKLKRKENRAGEERTVTLVVSGFHFFQDSYS